MDGSIEIYLGNMKKIESALLRLINKEKVEQIQEKELMFYLSKLKIQEDRHEFKSFLHLLSVMYENHHQQPNCTEIIEKIILDYKDYILEYFKNCELSIIFGGDKKLLLFLLKSGIITVDRFIFTNFDDFLLTYFYPEVKNFLNEEKKEEIAGKITEKHEEKREKGENESYLCEIIRNDSLDEFIIYVSQNNLSLKNEIEESIYETNPFLVGKNPTLIEYAAFFGSIKIIKYLLLKKVELTENLWLFAIHSQNTEIISILEENDIKPKNEFILQIYEESILCHNNEIADYIQENYFINDENIQDKLIKIYLNAYNFAYIEMEYVNKSNFTYFCNYDYPLFVDFLLKTEDININEITINEKLANGIIKQNETNDFLDALSYDNYEIVKLLLPYYNIDPNYKYKSFVTLPINSTSLRYNLLFLIITLFLLRFSFCFISLEISLLGFLLISLLEDICNTIDIPYSIRMLSNIYKISLSTSTLEYVFEEITVLQMAVLHNNTEIVKILFDEMKNIDVNALYEYENNGIFQFSSLLFASESNNEEIVKILISDPNIDINSIFKYQFPREMNTTVIVIIIIILFLSNISVLAFLLLVALYGIIFQVNAIIQFFKMAAKSFLIGCAIGTFSSLLIKYFIQSKPSDVNDVINEIALENNQEKNSIVFILFVINIIVLIAFISELISSLLSDAYTRKTVLHSAIENNNIEVVKLLLSKNNIDVNSLYKISWFEDKNEILHNKLCKNQTALNIATENNNVEIVNLLLSKNDIDINAKYKLSTYKKYIENKKCVLISLLESILCSLFTSHLRKSSLNIAIEKMNIENVKQLLEKSSIKIIKEEYKKLKKQKSYITHASKEDNEQIKDDNKNNSDKLDEIFDLFQKYMNENQIK